MVRLGEVAEFVNGDRGHNYPSPTSFVQTGIPFISAADLVDGRVSLSRVRRISRTAFERLSNGKVQNDDVLFCLRGSLGRTARVGDIGDGAIASSLVIIRPSDRIDGRYLYYLLAGPVGQSLAHTLNNGSVQPNISARSLAEARVPLPEVPEQRRIASALGALDDKIELNRRMSQTLEWMARALFKSWFVDFDPIRAKSEGRDPGLPSHSAELFPDSFDDSGEAPIPAGWRVADLGDLIELHYGRALKDADRSPGPIPVFGSNGQVGWHSEPLARGPGVVVGRKGNPGTVTWAPTDFFAIDTTFYVVSTVPGLSPYFLYHALREQDLARLSADSAVPGLSRNLAYMNRQLLPSPGALEAFDNACAPLAARSVAAQQEVGFLTTAQSALLARLLSASELTPSRPGTQIGG